MYTVTKSKIESVIAKAESANQAQNLPQPSSLLAAGEDMADEEAQPDTAQAVLLFEMTDVWHYLCQLSHKLQQNFQSVELHVQRMMRLRAQIRTENVGLKRSHLKMLDENVYDGGASKAHQINQQTQSKQAKTTG